MPDRSSLLALSCAVALACGARSGLPDASNDRDAGAGTAGVGAVGGVGGVGGSSGGVGGTGGASGCAPALEPELLVEDEGSGGPSFLEVDETHVYWTSPFAGRVSRVPKCGGAIETISPSEVIPLGIALFGPHVYWVDQGDDFSNGAVRRALKSGGGITTLASNQPSPWPIAVDAAGVFWSNSQGSSHGTLVIAHAGGTPQHLSSGEGYGGLALDATHVFFARGDVGRVPKTGGATEVLLTGRPHAWCVAVDEGFVYFTNYTGVVERIPKTGGAPQEIASTKYWRCLTVDSTHVYAAADGLAPGVFRFPKEGGALELLWEGGGTDVALDAGHIYWTTGAAIRRLAK